MTTRQRMEAGYVYLEFVWPGKLLEELVDLFVGDIGFGTVVKRSNDQIG